MRQEYGPDFQVSVIEPNDIDHRQRRLSIEEALIAVYRRESGENTTANFARIIEGYERSSRRADGFTGGALTEGETEPNTAPGVGPLPWTDADEPTSHSWMGLDWTDLEPLTDAYGLASAPGVYRIWDPEEPDPLEYIGQSGNLKSRLYRHRRNRDEALVFSYALIEDSDERHKREQIETDLIGAHWLATEAPPRDQF